MCTLKKMKMKMTKPTHGGHRKGAGRPTKYNEPTKYVPFRIPESKVQQVKELVDKMLEDFLKQKKK